jgi:hypothetical protein
VYAFLISFMRNTPSCPDHLILELTTSMKNGEQYKLCTFLLYTFLRSPVTSSVSDSYVFSTLSSNTFNMFSLTWQTTPDNSKIRGYWRSLLLKTLITFRLGTPVAHLRGCDRLIWITTGLMTGSGNLSTLRKKLSQLHFRQKSHMGLTVGLCFQNPVL